MSLDNISSLRLWSYRLIALIIVPAAFLVCLEWGLKLAEVGHSVNYTTTVTNNGRDYYIHNTRFIEQFFPQDIARQPYHFSYPVEKPDKAFRIFVLGASAAQGDPEHTYGFSRILETLLRERFPSIDFEIINTSITATNSHVVLPIAKEVSQHQPDLAIIYLGNNEVVGPYGSGNTFSKFSQNLSLIRASLQLKSTRIGQTIDSLLNNVSSQSKPQSWKGMEMFLDNQFRKDSSSLETVYSHYKVNLSDIVNEFREKNTPVILSTVGSNLKDSAPFASQHNPSLTVEESDLWKAAYQLGIEKFQSGEYEKALSAFMKAERIDDSFADLHFRIGQTYVQTRDFSKARDHFEYARDLDTLRFRADTRINDIIRNVAEHHSGSGFSLLDASELFKEKSPQHIPGAELFFEHVHLNFHGNYILAHHVAEQVLQFLPENSSLSEATHEFMSEHECSRLLALSQFDLMRIDEEVLRRLARPPFTNQLGHDELMARLSENYSISERSVSASDIEADDQMYRQALLKADNDPWLHFNYGTFLESHQKPEAAIIQFEAFTSLLPQSYKGHQKLALSLAESGRFEEAIPHYQAVIDLIHVTADRTETRMLKAYAEARIGRYDDSMETYKTTLTEDPSAAVDVYHAMAKLKLKTSPLPEALELLEKAITANNGTEEIPDIYFNYGHVLKKLKKQDQSIAAYKEAIKSYRKELEATDENDKETLFVVLGRGYFEIGEIDLGRSYLQQAIAENPTDLNHHLTLITALARNGRHTEANDFTDQALEIMAETQNLEAVMKLQSIKGQLARQ